MRTASLLRHAVTLGLEWCDPDAGAVEMMALSHRDRGLVAETAVHLSYLRPGDDNTRAREILAEALRRGDETDYWRDAAVSDGGGEARSVTGNGTSAGSASPSDRAWIDMSATPSPAGASGFGVVAAHRLLNSSAVVAMGISTLLRLWDSLPAAQREHLRLHMEAHSTTVDDGLKLLTLGLDSEAPPPTPSSNGSTGRSR